MNITIELEDYDIFDATHKKVIPESIMEQIKAYIDERLEDGVYEEYIKDDINNCYKDILSEFETNEE